MYNFVTHNFNEIIDIRIFLKDITLVLLAAGSSTRFGASSKKQWLYQDNKPLWLTVADNFADIFCFADIVIVSSSDEIGYMRQFANYTYVAGGNSRQESLSNALEEVNTSYVLVNDIARCCLDREMIERILSKQSQADCIIPTLKAVDTIYLGDTPVDRDEIKIIQTPQLSNTEKLKEALSRDEIYTDESSAIRAVGGEILFVEGSSKAHKLTTQADIDKVPCLVPPSSQMLVGFGIDIHPFEDDKEMKLCGVTIDSNFGFKAHSDGDVAIHALIDALMGAAGMGDIGELFPDTDEAYAGADSMVLLERVVEMIYSYGLEIVNTDMTILAQTPRLLHYKSRMKHKIAETLRIAPNRVNIKATTAEKLGFVGRKEGVTVHAVATLKYFDWSR